MKLRIGLDIDGCILDYTKLLTEDYYNWCDLKGYKKPKTVSNPRSFTDIISKEHMEEFEESREFSEYFFGQAREGVVEFSKFIKEIRSWYVEPQLFIITSRKTLLKRPYGSKSIFSRHLTEEWLKMQNIEYDVLEFDVVDKARICDLYYLDYMIEDDINNAYAIANPVRKVLLFDSILNQNIAEHENIIRVFSFQQIQQIISEKNEKILDVYFPKREIEFGLDSYEHMMLLRSLR